MTVDSTGWMPSRFVFAIAAALVPILGAHAQVTTILSPNGIADGRFGVAVAGVPDVNGDNRGDIIIGAPHEGANGAGRVYVVWGTVGIVLRTLNSPNPETDGHFGASVAGIPDVNGDNRGDILVGAPGESPGASPAGCGRAYIFSGLTGALLRTLASPNQEIDGGFGTSVGGIADTNNDGRGDVVIGAPFEDPGTSPADAGRAYIFSGSTGGLLRKLFPPAPGVVDGNFGLSVSGVPDVNGDARGDVVVGSMEPTGVQEGRAHIFSGASGARLRTIQSPGKEADGLFGFSVSGVPDVNGDKRGDIVVGAPGEDPGASPANAGRAHIYSGATGQLLHKLLPLHSEVDGHFGFSVSGVPDLNNDGRGDVIVGAPHVDPGAAPDNAGRAYIYSGATGARLFTLFSTANHLNGNYGAAVAGVPDVNGNGRGEVVVGGPGEKNGGVATGRAILHRF